MPRFSRLTFLLSTALLLSGPVWAQQAVKLRAGDHDGYRRLVFDWPALVQYNVSKDAGDSVEISFGEEGTLDTSAGRHGVSVLSADGAPLKVSVKIPPGANVRDFTVGTRVVLDIVGGTPGAQNTALPPPEKKESVTAAQKPADIKPAVKEEKAPPPAAAPVETVSKEALETHEEEKGALEKALNLPDAHVVSFTSTESTGLASFERNGWLWIVLDRSGVFVPPQVAGPHPELFSHFEKYELKGGVAFRTKLPEGYDFNVYGEGGGLVWRLVVSPNKRDKKPAQMERIFQQNNQVRGGTAFWPMQYTTKVLDVTDPSVGDVIKVVTVTQSNQFAGVPQELVDFNLLRSPIGLAAQAKVDDLEVNLTGNGVQITRPGGIALSRDKDISQKLVRENINEADALPPLPDGDGEKFRRIFDFDRWMMGGLQALRENQSILLGNMGVKDKNGRVQDLIALAKMNIANDRGPEALGFLTFAEDELPAISDGAEFVALRGAASALSGKYERAFSDLFVPFLKNYDELDYWRAYTLASLEDWRQAAEIMPKDFSVLIGYPNVLLEKIGLKLAETTLRQGDVTMTESILAVLLKDKQSLSPAAMAAISYLKGEAHRQSSEFDKAKEFWGPLATGPDDLYRAKAGLALTLLQLENSDIDYDTAIDRLEGLRYSWRGDELEAHINFTLGRLYIEKDQYLKGFTILRDAAGMSPDSDVGRDITEYMTKAFADLLINDKDLSALDAVTVYEEFRELTPTGDEGNRLVQKLAERLVESDLLDRASSVLQHQVDYRLEGGEKARVALRLGVIYLLDKNPRPALTQLDLARQLYSSALQGDEQAAKLREIDLLRARGLSQINKTEEALQMLLKMKPDADVNRLRADISWQARLWEDASDALNDLILDEALDPGRPLTEKQADLILNRAVALNLSGNRVELASMRKRYYDGMKKTPRGRLFDVVTRPRQTSLLSDRETIDAIVNEVDMFRDFLDAYRGEAISN